MSQSPSRGFSPARVWTWLRERTDLERAVLLASALSVAVPLAIVKKVPFVDYPEHIAQIATFAHFFDWRFHPYYKLALGQSEYFGFYVPAALFSKVLGVEIGTRVFTILALASLPISLAVFLSVHGRDRLSAAANACVAFTLCTFWGFMNFEVGVSVAILALAAQAAMIQRLTVRRAAWFAGAAVAVFYCHTYVYVWFVAACAVQLLAMAPRLPWRTSLKAAGASVVAGVPSGLAALYWLHASRFLERGEIGDRIGTVSAVHYNPLRFASLDVSLDQWLSNSFGVYSDGSGRTIAVAFLWLIGALLVLRIGLWVAHSRRLKDIVIGAPEALCVFAGLLYLVGPRWFMNVDIINDRYIIIAFALMPVFGPARWFDGRWTNYVRMGVSACLVAFCAYVASVHVSHFREVDEEMGDLDEALEHTAPGKKLLGLIYDTGSSQIPLPVFLHAHQYYQAHVGGMAAWSCVELAHSPILYRDGAAPPPFPARFEWTPYVFAWQPWGPYFDYFLVRTTRGRAVPFGFTAATNGKVREIYDGSRFKLYERTAQ